MTILATAGAITTATHAGTHAATNALAKYQFGEELGRGGIGLVRAAVDPALRREIAIKTLLRPDIGDERIGFIEEAQITGQLEHPNIVPIHELGSDPQGRPFLAMKRVEGRTLREVIREAETSRRPWLLDEPAMLAIIVKIGEAIAYAHSRGVIHRDLKPENIMVGEYGEVLVMDWGLAKPLAARDIRRAPVMSDRRAGVDAPTHARGKSGVGEFTVQGTVFGTPAYMPPEQALGEHDRIDERADIFALGGIFYAMLAMRAPYSGRNVLEVLRAAERGAVTPARQAAPHRQIPGELEAIAHKAMAVDPADRYESVRAMLADMAAYQQYRPITARRDRLMAAIIKWMRRHPRVALGGALSVVFGLIVGVLAVQLQAATQAAELAEANRLTAEKLAQSETERANQQAVARAAEQARADAEAARADAEQARAADAEQVARERQEMLTQMRAGDYQYVLGLLEAQVRGARDAAIEEFLRLWDAAKAAGKSEEQFIAGLREAKVNEYLAAFDRLFEQHETRGIKVTAEDYYYRGLIRHTGKKDHDGAIADYDRAVQLDPNYARAFINRATARKAKGDVDGAIADYGRAIQLDPNSAAAFNNRGIARVEKGDVDGAIVDYDRAIQLDPNSAAAFTNRGLARQAKGDVDGAIADYDRAIQLDPRNWQAWANRGLATQTTDRAATLHALQQAYRICDQPAAKQQLADYIRQLGGTVPE